jgi:alkylated DNA repair dioxygenase AlkB
LDVVSGTGSLFDVDVPKGFLYLPDFLTVDEEAALASEIAHIEFENFEMRGVTARRRVKFFGRTYDGDRTAAPPLPEFLLPLRDKVARWANVDPHAFAMALINEYTPGTPIGWHRDAPQYDIVAGISLLSSCRMKFRPYERPGAPTPTSGRRRSSTHEVLLERRSAYALAAEARSAYEHHIPAVTELRYSITFRTLRE